jgi:hypothetical protein
VKRLKAFSFGGSSKKMEKSGNIEDQVMDNLLRNYIKQQRQPEINCEGFDPDLASLYLERVLTEKETARYEIHLYGCSTCRNSVVMFARLAEQDLPLALASPAKAPQTFNAAVAGEDAKHSGSNWLAPLKQFFALFTIPRFALSAAAALVLAISIPLVISQRNKQAKAPETAAGAPQPYADSGAGLVGQSPASQYYDSNGSAQASKDSSPTIARNSAGDQAGGARPTSEVAGVVTGAAPGGAGAATPPAETAATAEKKATEKSDDTTVADNKPRTEESAGRAAEPPATVAAATQPAPRASERREQLERIESEGALKPPKNEQDASSKTLKPGVSDGTVATSGKPAGPTIRPEDAKARPPASSADSGGRGLTTGKSKSLRSDSDVRKDRASASRKVDNKTFWLIDDVWTDKDYRKDKELPVVTLTKDSDVYKEVLEKHANLQKFFKSFAANEKIIVVYKGTVYRVQP